MSLKKFGRRRKQQNKERLQWMYIGTTLIASAAVFGYFFGKYMERCSKYKSKQSENEFTIVVFGDSTTWGYDPDTRTRHSEQFRFTVVLEQELNKSVTNKLIHVISEGLNGRTINHNDKSEKNEKRKLSMNGSSQILCALYSHKPIDFVIILLGINDCKSRLNPSAIGIANEMQQMIIEKAIPAQVWRGDPCVLLIAPPFMKEITPTNKEGGWDDQSLIVSQSIACEYHKIANKYPKQIHFVDSNRFIQTGSDSIHIDAVNNVKFGKELAKVVSNIINKKETETNFVPLTKILN